MTLLLSIVLPLAVLYALFLFWYGGKGQPMSPAELAHFRRELQARARGPEGDELMKQLDVLLAKDDGAEFVMQNLARYRPKALYPPGYDLGDDPRAADRRYGRAIVPRLLRYGNVPIFIARRSGSFVEPAGSVAWHYVAMVRYRSLRDFLRFALAIERDDISVHKWAALETTHIFPVKPLISLIFVRTLVALVLVAVGAVLFAVLR